MAKLIAILLCIPLVGALMLGIYWLIWKLWCWVLPQLWTDGPANLISPNFWLFAGMWFLLMLVIGAFRSKS